MTKEELKYVIEEIFMDYEQGKLNLEDAINSILNFIEAQ